MTDDVAPFAPGDLVRVTDGSFTNFEAVVRAVDADDGHLSVDVMMLGRLVPIQTQAWQLARR
ncbi:MAG TPA: KOW motif-containing protein [Caulobacteraceae bacterium]|jgi:transcriptional antiterminator NusG|nr:KOW motif-containing protein [Caulobacteraceae bacterium]